MTATRSLARTRGELADFLRSRRERIAPEDVGLPRGRRRRTPGLRREEVAALAGVGVSWYTWLEQGREIGVSTEFLDRLARALALDAIERRHLFRLAHQRPPAEPGRSYCEVPALVRRLMDDLPARPSYVLNLRWDVLAYNAAADRLFDFSAQPPGYRNLLWMLFAEPALQQVFVDWTEQAPRMLSSFRRDHARADGDPTVDTLVRELETLSPDFRRWWSQHDVHAPCHGERILRVPDIGELRFQHASLIVDAARHLRLVYYAAHPDDANAAAFERPSGAQTAVPATPDRDAR